MAGVWCIQYYLHFGIGGTHALLGTPHLKKFKVKLRMDMTGILELKTSLRQ